MLKAQLAKTQGIIFDFDYTLGDSTEGIVESSNYALKRLRLPEASSETIKKTIGHTLADSYAMITGASPDEEAARQYEMYFKEHADQVMTAKTHLYPDTLEVLRQLRSQGFQIGVVTTKYHHRIVGIFEKYQALDLLDAIVGGDDVHVAKPSPEGLLAILERMSVPREAAIYVGDSYVDALTAQNAGVAFVGVTTGTVSEETLRSYPHIGVASGLRILLSD